MGQNLSKFCCCEESEKKLILIPKHTQVDRNIYTLRELSEEDIPETEYDNENLNETVQTLREIKINKSIIICRKFGQPSEEYVILDELGEGSYGIVVKVAHKITKNIRALKIINKLNLEKNFSKSKLYDEIKILKDIDHPNIIKIFEFFEDDENYYMVTEYCPEGDLAKHVEKMQFFNETIVKILMFQILSAVLYLHSRKIIHGDLKLENILIETLSNLKTAKSFRSSITYDLDKMKQNSLNANSNRITHVKDNYNYKNNNDLNVNETNVKSASKFHYENKNNNDINNFSKENNLKRGFSFSEVTNKDELDEKKNLENGRDKNEIIVLNELSKTNTIEHDMSLINENSKFNQLHNFDLNSINNENDIEISNTVKINEIEDNDKNNYDSFTKKEESVNINNNNPTFNLNEFKNTTESLFILNKKSSADLLHQRKLLFMKYNKEHKTGAKTLSTVNDLFYSNKMNNNLNNHQMQMKKNSDLSNNKNNQRSNYSITEEVESWEKSRINTERNSINIRANFNLNFFNNNNNAEKTNYVPVPTENNRNKNNSSRVIFTEEEVSYEDYVYSGNFFSKKINKDMANGAQASRMFSNNNAADFATKSKLNCDSNAKKVNIPNLNLNSIKNASLNNNYDNLIDSNSNNKNIRNNYNNNNIFNKRPILYGYDNNPLQKTDTIEELEKQLRSNFNNNNKNKNSQKDPNFNLNPNSKRTLNISNNLNNSASNQFETINSDSNTMSISMEQNFSTINQNREDLINLMIQKENGNTFFINNNDNNENNASYTNMNLTLDGINQLENFSNFEIKLIDFGCSKIFKKGNKKFKDLIGTLFYIAPEVIKNNYNEKCDLWSCGVIMYFLLVGFPPFFAMSDTEVFEQILSGDYSFAFAEFENVSESAKDLIKKLLEINPKKRLSAKEALEHEFFEEISSNRLNESNLDFSVLRNLKKNKIEQKFQQAVVSFLVYNFAKKDEIVNLRKVFKSIDIDQDGRISKEELLIAMQKFENLEITENEIQEMLYVIDSDKSGFLEYEEFITATINKKALLTDDNLKAAFYLFDQDKNGTISTEEIKNILIGKSRNIPEKVVNDLYKQINNVSSKGAGDAKEGKRVNKEINFEEFKKIIYQVVSED